MITSKLVSTVQCEQLNRQNKCRAIHALSCLRTLSISISIDIMKNLEKVGDSFSLHHVRVTEPEDGR